MARAQTVKQALRELDAIAKGSNPQQSSVIEEFQKCPEWQLAAAIVARAATQASRRGAGTACAAPAQWLPPLL